jgi:rhamnose transport system ATP-binding protein
MTPVLHASGISKSFGPVHALRDVSLTLMPGEVHALIGENGAGKSTLIRVLTGATVPDSGHLSVAGETVTEHSPLRARARGIAVIYQQPSLFPHLSVSENVALGLEPPSLWRTVSWSARHSRAVSLLTRVGADIDPDAAVERLSMPEQQLVEIARALGGDARVLIMDEPTASLSQREVERLFTLIEGLRQDGVAIVYVSHRLDEIFRLADRVTVLRDGRLVFSKPLAEVDRSGLVEAMVGRQIEMVFPTQAHVPGTVALETRGLCQHRTGIRNVNLVLREGEVLGLAGLVGSGRTELARLLCGLERPDAGVVLIRGRPATFRSPAEALSQGIGYVPEDRRQHGVIGDMSVAANLTLAILRRIARRGMLDRQAERTIASSLVSRLGIRTESPASPVSALSGGNQQKVALGRWLAASPRVLVLDEPTQGVDVGAKAEIYGLVSNLAEQGVAILLISSELLELIGLSDRVAVMREGTIVGQLDREDLTESRLLSMALGVSPQTPANLG